MSARESGGGDNRTPLRIAEWLFEPDLDRISCGDERRTLRPRVTDLLVCLAESPGELVSKRRLIDEVFQAEFVTENALTHLVAELRSAFGDSSRNPRYIETIPRRGYRLIAEVTRDSGARTEPPLCVLVREDGSEITLHEGENAIGRSPDAAVYIDVWEVSRHHARINVRGDVAEIEDLGSKNGTFVRGQRIEGRQPLQNADEIQIGLGLARFRFKRVDADTRTEIPDT